MEPLLPGLATESAVFFDDRRRPDFRDVFGELAKGAVDIATAVTRVRLSTVDLDEDETRSLEHFRVLVAEVNAIHIDAEARGLQNDPKRRRNLVMLRALLESGRLEVRSAPLGGWSPDFTVFSSASAPTAALLGFHGFQRPYAHRGPAFGVVHFGDAARTAARRHAELWESAHDIGPALWNILSRAESGAHRLHPASG